MFSQTTIRKDLINLGIGNDSKLIIHSSYKAIGKINGGPQTFLDALLDLIGKEGIVLMPAFNSPQVFDPANTLSECGIITELFRKMEGTQRSFHPTHSVSVRGPGAEEIAKKHETATALGVNSPIHFFIRQGASILLIGVNHNRNSAVHVAERIFRAPYINITFSDKYAKPLKVLKDGKHEDFIIRECPGCSENFNTIGKRLKEKGKVRFGKIGNALSRITKGIDLLDCVIEALKEDPQSLLCDNPACGFCPKAKKVFLEDK